MPVNAARHTLSPATISNSVPVRARKTRIKCDACSPLSEAVLWSQLSAIQRRRVILRYCPSSSLAFCFAGQKHFGGRFWRPPNVLPVTLPAYFFLAAFLAAFFAGFFAAAFLVAIVLFSLFRF
jgi:hypothetical protein